MPQSKKKDSRASWRHYNFTTAGPVDDYLYSMLPKRDPVLAEMEEYASQHDVPIVGPAVARVLQQLAMAVNARKVFELGSAIGYSTIWWAQAVGENGRVIYTDGDAKNAERARGYFARAGVSKQITLHTGDALEYLSEQKEEFDVIFNDVDKDDYPRVLRLVAPHLRKGGLFITDNVLWSGRVAEKNPDATTKAILEFNRKLYDAKEFYTTILPIRDGLAVALKK
ncbi:MAG TPA: class I SAM-dependent methyltransferase [Candidatus Sulfotelmatobacter sp.]|nr:class I SAM-dependent methyltransferase [Candidatus Sulfotelmatobacter sp.]